MAWTKITAYAVRWNTATNRGTVNLWFEGLPMDSTPHESLTNLDSGEFSAIGSLLGTDRDGRIAFDKKSRELAGGVEVP